MFRLPSSLAWVDPGLGRAPVLDNEEQIIADMTLAFLAPGGSEVEFTDPDLAELTRDALVGADEADESWEIYGVDVKGDRAWSRAAQVDSASVGAFFVFQRVDGEWLVDSEGLCALAIPLGDPCGALS